MICFGLCTVCLVAGYLIGVHGTLRWLRSLSAEEAKREGFLK